MPPGRAVTAPSLLIAGGGIGGLAAALALGRAGWPVQLFEKAQAFSEVGAGLQLGPPAVRILQAWGLGQELLQAACLPQALVCLCALSGQELARLPLGQRAVSVYGAPYVTLHRADLHSLLLRAVQADGCTELQLGCETRLQGRSDHDVTLSWPGGSASGRALIGADGLWGAAPWLGDGPPRATGHLAYRSLIPIDAVAVAQRRMQVSVWLGPRLHVVAYPVRGGECLNLVVIVQGQPPADPQSWDHAALGADLQHAMQGACTALQDLVRAASRWRLWTLFDRAPMRSAQDMARGRMALLGDAAHPMLPFLAQGAAMAIEDAAELGHCLAGLAQHPDQPEALPAALLSYAQARWPRAARVQQRSRRNGQIFHLSGPLRLARNAALRLAGPRLMDLPWLYGHRAAL